MGSCKLVVMFFGMTNSSTTFQDMINKIQRNIINEKKVVAFMDNVLVKTKMEKGHDCHSCAMD